MNKKTGMSFKKKIIIAIAVAVLVIAAIIGGVLLLLRDDGLGPLNQEVPATPDETPWDEFEK